MWAIFKNYKQLYEKAIAKNFVETYYQKIGVFFLLETAGWAKFTETAVEFLEASNREDHLLWPLDTKLYLDWLEDFSDGRDSAKVESAVTS